jgi:hypothetical protein
MEKKLGRLINISYSRLLENYSVIIREAVTMYRTHCSESF